MIAAFLATLLFAGSVVCASRTTRHLGAARANLLRLTLATVILAAWAHLFGAGLGGGGLRWFLLSGVIGFGLGDLALYESLPRIGPRLGGLMVQCLAAPFAILAEWLWLGTVLSKSQLVAGAIVLIGVGVAIAPREHLHVPRRVLLTGLAFGVVAALGQGLGAVVSRKAYDAVAATGGQVDGLSAAYQRIVGGLAFAIPPSLWLMLRHREAPVVRSESRGSPIWPWVVANALAGPSIGVGCYQWALATTPSGVVLPIVATMPVLVIPLAWALEGDRPTARSVWGGIVAVGGAVVLALLS